MIYVHDITDERRQQVVVTGRTFDAFAEFSRQHRMNVCFNVSSPV